MNSKLTFAALFFLLAGCRSGEVETVPVHATITPTSACTTHTAVSEVEVSDAEINVGDAVSVTVTLRNDGCLALGLPQYKLVFEQEMGAPVFEAPEPVVHNLSVAPGEVDTQEFRLVSLVAGQVEVGVFVSFEVHVGYPGPAYWGAASPGEPVGVVVRPMP